MGRRRYWKDPHTGHGFLIVPLNGVDGYVVRFTASCSGCTETMDGHNVNGHPIHPVHKCLIGLGCDECGYHGVVRREEWIPINGQSFFPHPMDPGAGSEEVSGESDV